MRGFSHADCVGFWGQFGWSSVVGCQVVFVVDLRSSVRAALGVLSGVSLSAGSGGFLVVHVGVLWCGCFRCVGVGCRRGWCRYGRFFFPFFLQVLSFFSVVLSPSVAFGFLGRSDLVHVCRWCVV